MIFALFYLQFHSVKNRLVTRFKRLKQPKYLVGAIVGGAYFYFYFFRFLFRPPGFTGSNPAALPEIPTDPLLYESLGAVILFGIVLLAWIIPHQRAALVFTEAEVAFLFPAPVGRRGLIHFKLLRSQLGILVTVLFFTLISSRLATGGHWLMRAAGWWVILSTLNLHLMGSSFALTRFMDRGLSTWKRRVAVLALVGSGVGAVGWWAVREFPELTSASLAAPDAMMDYAKEALVSGPLPYLLAPFRLVVQPYLAPDGRAFLGALIPALLLMGLHYRWVIRSDVAFEEASVEASQKLAERIAAVRAGQWGKTGTQLKRKRPPFQLRPTGPPFVALFWKNLISAGGAFTGRLWLILAIGAAAMSFAAVGMAGDSAWPVVGGTMASMLGVWMVLFGPQVLRQDFRQDLPNADVLKTFPLRGWQIALGEILAPAVILTGVQWLLLIVAVACGVPSAHGKMSGAFVLALGAGVAVALPALNLISLLIPNAAVLLFPAWFQAGRQGPQGIEATGQRLIFAIGQFLAFALALIPAAAAGFGIFLLANILVGAALGVIAAAVAATLVLAVEAALGLLLLGRWFERFDLTTEQGT